jgi:fluoride exporter
VSDVPRLVDCLLVGLGGLAGSIARYAVGVALVALAGPALPWGTLAVNVSGAFVAGLLLGIGDGRGIGAAARLGLVTGFLGGYTTFSALAVESVLLVKQQGGLVAAGNVGANLVVGLAAAALGLVVGRAV